MAESHDLEQVLADRTPLVIGVVMLLGFILLLIALQAPVLALAGVVLNVPATHATLPRLARFGLVNAYLVHEPDGLTLVDTAVPGSAKTILKAAERLGAPILRIALTHAHGDAAQGTSVDGGVASLTSGSDSGYRTWRTRRLAVPAGRHPARTDSRG